MPVARIAYKILLILSQTPLYGKLSMQHNFEVFFILILHNILDQTEQPFYYFLPPVIELLVCEKQSNFKDAQ
jgi:hypothetical protein